MIDDDDVGLSTMDDLIGSEYIFTMAKKLSADLGDVSKNLRNLIKSTNLSNLEQHIIIGMCDTLHKDGAYLHGVLVKIEKEMKELEQLKANLASILKKAG